jgi:hypothetical protein
MAAMTADCRTSASTSMARVERGARLIGWISDRWPSSNGRVQHRRLDGSAALCRVVHAAMEHGAWVRPFWRRTRQFPGTALQPLLQREGAARNDRLVIEAEASGH